MSREQISEIARKLDLVIAPDWSGVDAVWPLLEMMRREGAVVLIKLDGERSEAEGVYTVMVSKGGLGEGYRRGDGPSLEDALAQIISEYADAVWR